MKAPFLIGRLLFGGFFLYNGLNHFRQRKNLSQYAASKNVPMSEAAVVASGVALTVGGASILLGIKPKLGTIAIMGFLSSVSPIVHDFWRQEDPTQKMNDTINFMKNMALLGASLTLMGVEEPWPVSVPVAQPKTIKSTWRKMRNAIAA